MGYIYITNIRHLDTIGEVVFDIFGNCIRLGNGAEPREEGYLLVGTWL
jgi:hypothetical protein